MSEQTRIEIGKKLRNAREKLRLTQVEVAEKADIAPNYYAMLERGEKNATADVLGRLAKVLKVKSSDILPF